MSYNKIIRKQNKIPTNEDITKISTQYLTGTTQSFTSIHINRDNEKNTDLNGDINELLVNYLGSWHRNSGVGDWFKDPKGVPNYEQFFTGSFNKSTDQITLTWNERILVKKPSDNSFISKFSISTVAASDSNSVSSLVENAITSIDTGDNSNTNKTITINVDIDKLNDSGVTNFTLNYTGPTDSANAYPNEITNTDYKWDSLTDASPSDFIHSIYIIDSRNTIPYVDGSTGRSSSAPPKSIFI